jgi:hypothetical protein
MLTKFTLHTAIIIKIIKPRTLDFTLPYVGNTTNSGVTSGTFDEKTLVVGNNMYVLWVSGDEDNTDVYLKISSDKGLSFDKTIDLSNNPASLSYEPQITTVGENVYVVWEAMTMKEILGIRIYSLSEAQTAANPSAAKST